MAERKLTLKEILRQASGNKVSPANFLSTYKEFLLASPFGIHIQATYEKYENGELFPSNALAILRRELFTFVQQHNLLEVEAKRVAKEEKERLKEEIKAAKIAEAEAAGEDLPEEGKKEKKYLVTILDERDQQVFFIKTDKDGNQKELPLCAGFDKYQDAERWGARRVFLNGTDSFEKTDPNNQMYGLNGWKAKIASVEQVDRNGEPIVTVVTRNRAAEILQPKRAGTVMKVKRPSGGLNISMCNVKGSDSCHFSHG